jgi:hypothetical protein
MQAAFCWTEVPRPTRRRNQQARGLGAPAVCAVRDDAFQVTLAREREQIAAALLDVVET